MKMRTRMTIAFVTVVLAPIIMMGICLMVLNTVQQRILVNSYGAEADTDLLNFNSLKIFESLNQEMRSTLSRTENQDKSLLEDTDFLEELNSQYKDKYSFIMARRNNQLFYSGAEEVSGLLVERLPAFGEMSKNGQTYLGGDIQYMVGQYDFLDDKDAKCTIFLITDVSGALPQLRSSIADIIIIIITILVLTAILLTSWLYSTMVRPLANLQKATREIKQGNLDYALNVEGKDEISELCQDFESMRKRLKVTAEEQLQTEQDNKILISNISHDLKTPITAIKGYVEGILDGVASSPEKLDKYIRTIYNKANDMDRLIDELTLYSKIDTNRIPYNFTKIPIQEYLEEFAQEAKMELEASNIELAYYNYLTEPVYVIGDKEQLKRVINNIISNSVKYMDKKKGIINIRLRDEGDFVHIEIEDNGKGIAMKDLPYIFDRFYRADSSRNSSTGGSGIGLSIVKKIIEDHGGRIWATSKENTGTSMQFVLRKYQEVKA